MGKYLTENKKGHHVITSGPREINIYHLFVYTDMHAKVYI